jgi:hypothetical protein
MNFDPGQVNGDVIIPVMKIFHRDKNPDRDQKSQHDVISGGLAFLTVAFSQEFHFHLALFFARLGL